MTSPIDPIRRAAQMRRARRSDVEASEESNAEPMNLPVPVGQAQTVAADPIPDAAGAFAAQLIGQDGQKRGLRAGPAVIDTAKATYNRTEWSGTMDRRARIGRVTKTEI